MNEKNIVLNNVEAAKEFVKAASECDFDIDVYFNRIALDAKSLLGILSLDLRSLLQRRKRRIQYSSGKICGIIIEAWMFEKKLLPGAAVFFCFMHFFVDK